MAVTNTNAKAAVAALKQAIDKAQQAEKKMQGGDPKCLANIRASWQRADFAMHMIPVEDEPEPEVVADEAEPSEAD